MLTVVLDRGQLDDSWGRVIKTANAEGLEHHLEEDRGSCRVDYHIRRFDAEKLR